MASGTPTRGSVDNEGGRVINEGLGPAIFYLIHLTPDNGGNQTRAGRVCLYRGPFGPYACGGVRDCQTSDGSYMPFEDADN
ncbi:unnamed protein product [Arctogadus glacialis]